MQLTRTTPAALSRVLERVSSLNPTYRHIGVTLDSQTETEQHAALLGTGQAAFERGKFERGKAALEHLSKKKFFFDRPTGVG